MKTRKTVRLLMVATVVFIQLTYLATIIKEKYEVNTLSVVLASLVIASIVLLSYKFLDLHHDDFTYEKVSVVIWVPVGAVICYFLNIKLGLGNVLSAGITGTLASFVPLLNKESDYLNKVPIALYCGAFVGMSSVETTPSIGFVIAGGILAGLFLMLSKDLFLGIGGKLGLIAFGGVLVVTLINWLAL